MAQQERKQPWELQPRELQPHEPERITLGDLSFGIYLP